MTPLSLSIRELLANTGSFYQIPDYQRPYKWTDKQLERLWDDIVQAFKSDAQEGYFLGPIITTKGEGDSDYSYKDVIDGQQRLTTLAILCCVVKEKYPNINNDRSDEPSAVKGKTIDDAIADGDAKRIRFRMHENDNAQTAFDTCIAKKGAINGLEKKPSPADLKNPNESKHKFINTAFFFIKKLGGLSGDLGALKGKQAVGEFIDFLFNKVRVIRIECPDLISAMKIFQTINSTGIDLTNADLIKSFLLREVAVRHKDNAKVRDDTRKQIAADWGKMESIATPKECGANMEDMLAAYEYYHRAHPRKKSMYEELVEAFKDDDPDKVAAKLKDFMETYKEKIYGLDDEVVYSLRYLPWSIYWKSILFAVLRHRPANEFGQLARALRRFYYAYWIGGKTITRIKVTSFNIIEEVKKKKASVKSIKKVMQERMDEDRIADDARKNLALPDIDDEAWCKPLLLLMEYAATDDSKLSFIEMDNTLHLEHVLPLEYSKEKEWGHISDRVAGKYLRSAGNLTLLSGKKNIVASNASFKEKISVYKGHGRDGKQNQRMTSFQITQKIVAAYDKHNKQWNEESMRDRRRWFLEEAEKILEIGINPKKD